MSPNSTHTRGLVPRRPLLDRLAAVGPGEIVLVCAPAGAGKTALLRWWAASEEAGGAVAWVSVERAEQDAQRFWFSVVDQLAAAAGEHGVVERVGATPTFGGGALVDRLLSDLHALERPLLLVIDDLHELRSPDALDLLDRFLTGLPGTMRVVLASREDPGLGLHRLRVAGALTEIRGPDLRFTVTETRELLAASGIALSESGSAVLTERTEGWAAGLRLAAISLAGHPDPERFVAEFSGSERTVAGYLLAEVLERRPPEVRDLLLRTSVVERVNGPLADTLTGRIGSEAILLDLEDANAFVVSLDAGRTWFRYHHLLSDLLRLELRRVSPATIRALHRAAAGWFEEHGHPVDAIRHALEADDWMHAARVLADNAVDLVFDGRKATLRALLADFPPGAAEEDAELALAFATGRLYEGLLEEGATHVAVAERLAATLPAERRRLFELRLASARLWLACQRGDFEAARQAMAPFDARTEDELAHANDHRASALMNLGAAELWCLRLGDARRDLEAALTLTRRIGRPYLEVGCLGLLALTAVLGSAPLAHGLRSSEEAVTIADVHGWGTHRILAPAVAAAAAALVWLGRLDDAEGWLARVDRDAPRDGELDTEPALHHVRGVLRLAQGRFDEALDEFRAAERLQTAVERAHGLAVDAHGWMVLAHALKGDRAATHAALAATGADARGSAGVRIAAAALALAEDRPREAVEVLGPVIDETATSLHPRWAAVHGLVFDAAARERLGDRARAEASIERALELAEPDGIILPFALAPARDLLERHPRHRTAHATLLGTILAALAGRAPRPPGGVAALPEDLSGAELRVARYLASNLKAPEIAAELCVSANTVRTHMRHIYTKLGAHSRGEAVARARDLGLLAPAQTRARSPSGTV